MNTKDVIVYIREAKWFSNLTTAIIIFYSSVLGLKTLGDIESAFAFWLVLLDRIVTVYFLVEIVIKMSAEKHFKDFFKSSWNIFDLLIVIITIMPLENSALAPIARLLRIFRVLRLITARPELKKLIDMVIKAIPSIIDIVVLMFIIFYIYAIVGNFLFAKAPSGLWEDFLISMLTLFRVLTFEDWTDVMYEAMTIYSWAWLYFVSFVVIAAFVFYNLFVAVIIGEMEKMSEDRQEKTQHDQNDRIQELSDQVKALQSQIKDLTHHIKSQHKS